MKKIVCDPYVTLVFFYEKISHHTTLRMTMYLVFEKMPFFLLSDFMRQLRDLLFASCTVSLGSFPTSTHSILCVVGYVRYTTNVRTMGICCVLLEPPINVAYLLQLHCNLKHFLLTRGLARGSPSRKRHFGIAVIRRMLCQRSLNGSALSKGVNFSLRGEEGILTP